MRKKMICVIISTLLISIALPIVGVNIENVSLIPKYSGNILYVGGDGPGNYSTIQEAIDDALDGDTVFVYFGTYDEHVIIDTSINLIGYNKKNTIINAHGYDAIYVSADNVKIQSFTIKNAATGIVIYHSINNLILKNNIKENDHYGIYIESSNGTTISENTISDNLQGGIYLFHIINSEIKWNKIRNNEKSGIYLKGSSNKNIFYKNSIKNNQDGIILSSQCDENSFFKNIIRDNSGKGVHIFDVCSKNQFYHNDFIANTHHAFDPSTNFWNINQEGNYWDDYKGVDISPKDGIGDEPYIIPGGYNQDGYPLMNRYNVRSIQISNIFFKILFRFFRYLN